MYCKWCGMQSKNEERCEWCGKLPPETDEPAAEASPPAAAPSRGVPDLPPAALSPDILKGALARQGPPWGYCLEHFLAWMLPIILISMLVSHAAPGMFSGVVLIDLFFAGLLLAVTNCIRYFEDEYADVTGVVLATAAVGPVLAFIGYLILGAIRGEYNRSLLALLVAYFVTMLISAPALQGVRGGLDLVLTMQIGIVLRALSLVAIFAGWFMSAFWRPLNA